VGKQVTGAHLLAVLTDYIRAVVMALMGIVVGRAVVGAFADAWQLAEAPTMGLLLLGGAVSAGILLRDLGGLRRRRALFATGLALGILGARLL
jgi:hypothetical protein